MTARWLVCASVVTAVAHGPTAQADEPYMDVRSAGSPAATLTGEWTYDRATAHLQLRGATIRLAPTSFDAGITFAVAGRRSGRCPVFLQAFTTTSFVDPAATFEVRTDLRFRRPGGRWSRWMAFEDLGVSRGLQRGTTPSARLTYTPVPTCRGPLEYGWRVHGSLAGEAVLADTSFDLEVQER